MRLAVAILAVLLGNACGNDEPPATSGPIDDAAADVGDAATPTLDAEDAPDGACACTKGHSTGQHTTSLACFFGAAPPKLDAAFSPCGGYDVQAVRQDYAGCNRVVVQTGGYYQGTTYVFERTTGTLLSARWGDDTSNACGAGVDDTAACGSTADSCFVYCRDSREPPPAATCTGAGADAGVDAPSEGG